MKSGSALALIVVFSSLLTQCTFVDPDFARHESQILAAAAPDSIVGMWYRHEPQDLLNSNFTLSYLFRRDGTGITRNKIGDFSGGNAFTWQYNGHAQWTIHYPNSPGTPTLLQSTGTRLLLAMHNGAKVVLVRNE